MQKKQLFYQMKMMQDLEQKRDVESDDSCVENEDEYHDKIESILRI